MRKIVELKAAEIRDVVGGVITFAVSTTSFSSNLQVSQSQLQTWTATAQAPTRPVSALTLR
jgi:DNA-binding transcriptional regulator YiaG